jgi:plasmid replication initiation protein
MLSNSVIRKDNRIITACYRLTLNEQRLVLTAIAKIPFDEKIPDEVEITAQEFLALFPDVGEKNVHNEIQDAVDRLYERSIRIEDPIKKKKFRWINSTTFYKKGEGRVGFSFGKEIIPYLQQLKTQFTKYRLGDIASLKSIYSIRLFEMLMQFQGTGIALVDLDKFKERLGIQGKYSAYKDLKKRVIEPAVSELNNKSHLTITFKSIREGRAIKKLQFFFSEK